MNNRQDMLKRGRAYNPRGEKHYRTKLTETDIREVRCRAKTGETQQALADDFDISQTAVSKIVRRMRWDHVV